MRDYWKNMKEPRLDETEFKEDLGHDFFIFVGSSIDNFADVIPSEWIVKELSYCSSFDNHYLFQSKNPKRFNEFVPLFPSWTTLGTTLETNRDTSFISSAPCPVARFMAFSEIKNFEKMVSIEPIMDFDLEEFLSMFKIIKPKFVSIGADSKNNNLPEPSKEKVELLIKELKKFTEVKIKSNLNRLIRERSTRKGTSLD